MRTNADILLCYSDERVIPGWRKKYPAEIILAGD